MLDQQESLDGCVSIDADTFAQLYERWRGPVRRFVQTRGASAEDAEDVTSETFAAAWQARHSFRSDQSAVSSWLFGIARRQAANAWRAQGRQQRYETAASRESARLRADEDQVCDIEQRSEIHRILQCLDARQRAVVELRFLHDLSVSQVASILDEAPAAVSQLQLRALERLRRFAVVTLSAALALGLAGTAVAASDTRLGRTVQRAIEVVVDRLPTVGGARDDDRIATPDGSTQQDEGSLGHSMSIALDETGVWQIMSDTVHRWMSDVETTPPHALEPSVSNDVEQLDAPGEDPGAGASVEDSALTQHVDESGAESAVEAPPFDEAPVEEAPMEHEPAPEPDMTFDEPTPEGVEPATEESVAWTPEDPGAPL